jgi:hypothetical protein
MNNARQGERISLKSSIAIILGGVFFNPEDGKLDILTEEGL